MINIDLDYMDSDDGGPSAGQPHGAPPGRPGRRGLGRPQTVCRLVPALAVVAVLAVVIVANVNERARSARADAAVAAMPGLVAPLGEPLDVVWERPYAFSGSGLVFGGVDAGAVPLDPATGEPIPLPIADGRTWGPCAAVHGAEPPMLVCWHYVYPEAPAPTLEEDGTNAEPASPDPAAQDLAAELVLAAMADAQVMAVSLVDGAVLGERPMAIPNSGFYGSSYMHGYGSVGGDLVTGSQHGTTFTVSRVSPLTGVERWTTSFEVPAAGPLGQPSFGAWVEVRHGYVVVHGPTTAVLSADDGRRLGSWELPTPAVGEVRPTLDAADVHLTERGYAVWDGVDGGVRPLQGTWLGSDGRELPIDGRLAEPEVTDGSDDDVLLLSRSNGTKLVGVDLGTGEDLWTAGLRGGEVLMRRDGAAVVSDGQRLVAFDLRSGQERWSRPVAGMKSDAGSVTDGRNAVVVTRRDHQWVLEAISLDGGKVSWTAAVQSPGADAAVRAGSAWLTQVGTQALVVFPEAVLGLG